MWQNYKIKHALILLMCFALYASPHNAAARQAPVCPRVPPLPKVAITQLWADPVFDNSQSLANMQVLARNNQVAAAGKSNQISVGLTLSQFAMQTAWRMQLIDNPNHRPSVCAWVQEINISMGFPSTAVYVAHELPVQSCGHRAVLEHEQLHVSTNAAIVLAWRDAVTPTFLEGIRNMGVVYANSPAEAEAFIRQSINATAQRLTQAIDQDRNARQNAVDSPQEYQRVSSKCNGEIAKVLSLHIPAR